MLFIIETKTFLGEANGAGARKGCVVKDGLQKSGGGAAPHIFEGLLSRAPGAGQTSKMHPTKKQARLPGSAQ